MTGMLDVALGLAGAPCRAPWVVWAGLCVLYGAVGALLSVAVAVRRHDRGARLSRAVASSSRRARASRARRGRRPIQLRGDQVRSLVDVVLTADLDDVVYELHDGAAVDADAVAGDQHERQLSRTSTGGDA